MQPSITEKEPQIYKIETNLKNKKINNRVTIVGKLKIRQTKGRREEEEGIDVEVVD